MTNNPTLRLGIGEAVEAGGQNFQAERLFLEALWRHAPLAIADLVTIADAPPTAPKSLSDLPVVEGAVLDWCERWNLDRGWLRRSVQRHVRHWREFPQQGGRFIGHIGAFRSGEWPTAPSWSPIDQTEAAYRRAIDEYIAQIKAMPAFHPAPAKRHGVRDFEWLVRYQVRRESYASIAKDLSPAHREAAQTTVRKAVVELASVLGLHLRAPGRPGRPKKVRKLR